MYRSSELYISPQSGEFPPISDVDQLEQAFRKISDNEILVHGDPFSVEPVDDRPITQVAIREEAGVYMNFHPQVITISPETTSALEDLMAEWYAHYPTEPSYAQTRYGVPMLLTRFDGVITPDGKIGVCEFDDVPTGFNALSSINPVAASYVKGMSKQLDGTLHSAFLPEEGYTYPHDDDIWLPRAEDEVTADMLVIPRARRAAPGFKDFIDNWGSKSIVGAWERDSKGPLIAMHLGALASNVGVALELGQRVKSQIPFFMKALNSSRTEAAGAMASSKWGIKGASSEGQLVRKFEKAGIPTDTDFPMVVQPFHRPPTMAEIGLSFRDDDSDTVARFAAEARGDVSHEMMSPGNENRYHVLSRIYGVYMPNQGHRIIGGFWMARPNAAIIHGSSDSITGPIQVEGLTSYTVS